MSTTYDTPTRDRTVRVGYLVTGLVFLGLTASWALWTAGLIGAPALGFLVPVVLVVAGSVGILALLLTAGQRRRAARRATLTPPHDDHPVPDPEPETDLLPLTEHDPDNDTKNDTQNDTKEIR